MNRVLGIVAASFVMLALGRVEANSIFIGSIADWSATPAQVVGDKTFTYVSASGWSSAELVTISTNVPQNSYTLSIDGLSNYIGPQTLTIAYEVAISSSDVFQSISLDQNFSGSSATTYKDMFVSLQDLQANPTPGSGTWALSVIDSGAGTTVAVSPIQTLWIRDTIVLDASGSVLSISNTIVQVPEPAGAGLVGCGILLAGTARRWRKG
jgi:hypothetical protein